MDYKDYQTQSKVTDQNANLNGVEGVHIPLLGLAGETGTLLTKYKKKTGGWQL